MKLWYPLLIVSILAGGTFALAQQAQQPTPQQPASPQQASTRPPQAPPQPLTLVKLSERLYRITGGRGAEGGLYVGDNAALLIDVKQTKESVDQTLAAVESVTGKPIEYVVNTHSDGDHVYGNRFLPDGVTVVAHENCRKEFLLPGRDGSASEWRKPELAAHLPSITYREKMELFLGSQNVELWYFGVGHTTGDTVVYFPEEKTAFLADQYFAGRPPLIHAYKGGNSFAHVNTLEKMLATLADATTFCSGHSAPADRAAIRQHIAELQAMQAKVGSLMGQGKTLDEIKGEFQQNQSGLVEIIHDEIGKSAKK